MRPFTRFLFFLAIIVAPVAAFAQNGGKEINVVHANSLKGNPRQGFERLIGNVELEHKGAVMNCDSAHLFDKTNTMLAYGHVHIRQGDSINMYGDQLKYDGNSRKAELTKNVSMTDGDMTLTTDAIVYDMTAKVASYSSGGTIVNKENTLTSQIGAYSTEGKVLTFKKNVVLNNPEYTMNCDTLRYLPISKVAYFLGPTTIKATNNSNFIYCENGFYDTNADICQFQKNAYILTKHQELRGDSIWYNRKIGLGKAMKNVQIRDTAQDVTIRGELAIHNEVTDVSLVTGNALYIQAFKEDSLFLHADTLKSITLHDSTELKKNKIVSKSDTSALKKITDDTIHKEPGTLVIGYPGVKFYKHDLQGKCDSLAWTSADSTMRLFGDPVLWSGESQMTADKVTILTSHGEIMRMDMDDNAFIVSQEDSTRYNQIKGRHMTGYFRDNDLYKIYVEGNGQTLYYAKEDNNLLVGVNRADCSRLVIGIKDDDVKSITFYGHPDATLYPPLDLPPKEALLKDFKWRGNEQPKSVQDLFLK